MLWARKNNIEYCFDKKGNIYLTKGKITGVISNLVTIEVDGPVSQNEICFILLGKEKLMAEEGLKKTDNDLIHIGCPIPFNVDEFLDELDDLMKEAYNNKSDIRKKVAEIVTTYHPDVA